MKNNIKTPCQECPFKRSSAPGWLGGETVESTLEFVENEVSFSCHKTREDNIEHNYCRGYLLFVKKKCKLPRFNLELKKVLDEIPFMEALNSTEILNQKEFIEHHNKL